jgi:hypothetical protein
MGIENYEEKIKLVKNVGKHKFIIEKGFVPNMKVPAYFYCNGPLQKLMFEEYRNSFSRTDGKGRNKINIFHTGLSLYCFGVLLFGRDLLLEILNVI